MLTKATRSISLLVLLSLVACGEDDPEANAEHEDPAEHACEHTGEEGERVRASAERDESAPRIELGDEPFTVELVGSEPSYLRVEVDEDTPVLLFVSAENVVTGLFHEDEEEQIDGAGANEFCEDDIPEHFDLDLHEPGTYYLELAASALDEVWVLLTEAEGHAH